MAYSPPSSIARRVEQLVPGFWYEFVSAANWALGGVSQPIYLTSWWRSPAANLSVGGHPASQHLCGTAFDIAGPGTAQAIPRLQAAGFIVIPYAGSHIHAQAWPAGVAERVGLV